MQLGIEFVISIRKLKLPITTSSKLRDFEEKEGKTLKIKINHSSSIDYRSKSSSKEVFVIYSLKDSEIALKFVQNLREKGCSVCVDNSFSALTKILFYLA